MTTYDTNEKAKRGFAADFELADLGTRLIALIIDNIVLAIVAGAGWFGSRSAAGGVLGFLLGLAYQWFFLTQNNGQTIGKSLMSIRVVKTNGAPLTGTDVILRYLGYYLNSAVFMLGWLWAAFDADRQGWHDKLASTLVVRAR